MKSKNSFILVINTSGYLGCSIALLFENTSIKREVPGSPSAQNVLFVLSKLMNEKKLSINDIAKIQTSTGPGSFTGLRIGVAVSQALGLMLRIPVNSKSIGAEIVLIYK